MKGGEVKMQLNLKNKTAAAISSLALLANTVTPVWASVEGSSVNSNTGADSSNVSEVVVKQQTTLVQNNNADIKNNINMKMNTGKNTADKNTGLGVVDTGDVVFNATVFNQANVNVADLEACGGCDFEIHTENDKTGHDSWNKSRVEVLKDNAIYQDNNADVDNRVNADINTGKNSADKNTTGGFIKTGDAGDALSGVYVGNLLNNNLARMSGSNGGGAFLKSSNETTGQDSDNESTIKVRFANLVTQNNNADVNNRVNFDANTGRNSADKNTGIGEIITGDVVTSIGLETIANENYLDFDGCCDIEFVTGNEKTGADSWNSSKAVLDNTLEAYQSNCGDGGLSRLSFWHRSNCRVDNTVNGDLNTGDNSTSYNTNDDVVTGDVDADVQVVSETNQNILGSVSSPSGNNSVWAMMMLLMFGMN